MKALTKTEFHFDGQKSVYHGKVRDVYDINDDLIVMVATTESQHSTSFCQREYRSKDKF